MPGWKEQLQMMGKLNPAAMHQRQTGFTLIEISIVLFILALVLGGLLPTLSSQVEQRHLTETRARLDEIKEALIGYAIINGRLPCPASSSTNGKEDPTSGTGSCTHPHDNNSYVPAATLGLSGTDSSGLIEDAWGNPIRYGVADGSSNAFTKSISGIGISNISSSTIANLDVCSSASGATSSSCSSSYQLTNNAVAVIYSTGKNGGSGGTGADETENPNINSTDSDHVYVSHDISATSGNAFDDLVTWLSPNVLVNRMVSAGKLP
jgi:prepilin-type N-terminal cleavage/methylation domain-containing protein